MCLGNQEIFTECGCRGEFLETRLCTSLAECCRGGRMEEGICYLTGKCSECDDPQQGGLRTKRIVPHGTPRPHQFASLKELDAYYEPRQARLRKAVGDAFSIYQWRKNSQASYNSPHIATAARAKWEALQVMLDEAEQGYHFLLDGFDESVGERYAVKRE
ncbi:MAG: hypothetical protein M1816_008213 [Peltula sp. TS41687]|nr:MAG: hypothetical protein M1816_008213 [Peltula sp. TS41687]